MLKNYFSLESCNFFYGLLKCSLSFFEKLLHFCQKTLIPIEKKASRKVFKTKSGLIRVLDFSSVLKCISVFGGDGVVTQR